MLCFECFTQADGNLDHRLVILYHLLETLALCPPTPAWRLYHVCITTEWHLNYHRLCYLFIYRSNNEVTLRGLSETLETQETWSAESFYSLFQSHFYHFLYTLFQIRVFQGTRLQPFRHLCAQDILFRGITVLVKTAAFSGTTVMYNTLNLMVWSINSITSRLW